MRKLYPRNSLRRSKYFFEFNLDFLSRPKLNYLFKLLICLRLMALAKRINFNKQKYSKINFNAELTKNKIMLSFKTMNYYKIKLINYNKL